VQRCKSVAMRMAPALRKTFKKWGHGRRFSHSRTQTSAQELALAMPLKCSTKFATKASGLSPAEKASIAGVEATGKKTSSAFVARNGMTRAPKHSLNLFDSGSSVSDDETSLERPRKCSQETPLSGVVPKSLVAKGIFEWFLFLCSCL
jgi:hypothetical protein